MMSSSAPADDLTMPRYSRCRVSSGVSSTMSVMPMIPFIGVRISWLMFARNSLFMRLALSAASLACISARVACFWSVTSITVPTSPVISPFGLRSAALLATQSTVRPSCSRTRNS